MQEQKGRSMIEMIGVLGIIGVISVGGMSIISKAMQNHHNIQIMTDTSSLANIATKTACQSDGYASFTDLIYQSGKYSSNLTYSNNKFIGVDDVSYEISKIGNTDELAKGFIVKIGNLSDEQCALMAISDWGSKNTSGFLGISITKNIGLNTETGEITNAEGTYDSPINMGDAANNCNKGYSNNIQLLYRGCH